MQNISPRIDEKSLINPTNPNISIHILHTVLYTFPNELTRRICLTSKSFFKMVIGGRGGHFVFRGNGEGISRHQQSIRGGGLKKIYCQ